MPIDRESQTWKAVKAHCEAELKVDSRNLEQVIGLDATMVIRGRIQALRAILALTETKPEISESVELY